MTVLVKCLFGPFDGQDKPVPKGSPRWWRSARWEGGRYLLDWTEAFSDGQGMDATREWFLVWRPDDR